LLELGRRAERERRRRKGGPYPDACHGRRIGWGQGIDLRGCHDGEAGDDANCYKKARHAQEATAIVISGLDS
jgi:hypothetical protein